MKPIISSLRGLSAALVLALPALAMAQQTSGPTRSARLDLQSGPVAVSQSGEAEWSEAVRNQTLARGDRLQTERGGRSGLNLGNASVRMDALTRLDIHVLEPGAAQLVVMQGSVRARLRALAPRENFELDTPHLAFRASEPGDYRMDVDTQRGTTRVTVFSGAGIAYGENGQPQSIEAGQQIVFSGRALSKVSAVRGPAPDVFDRWVATRELAREQQLVKRAVPAAAEVVAAPRTAPAAVVAQTSQPYPAQPYVQPYGQTYPQVQQTAPQVIQQPAYPVYQQPIYQQPQVVTVVQDYTPVYSAAYVYAPWPRAAFSPVWYGYSRPGWSPAPHYGGRHHGGHYRR